MSQGEKCQIARKVNKTPKLIALKIRTQAESETGKFVSAQTIGNLFHEAVYNRRTARRKQYTSKTNRKKRVYYGKEHENVSHEFWWTFVFTDERKLFMLFKSDGQEKVWRLKSCELGDKNLTATMLNTMDNGAPGALNGLGDLCFISGTMDHYFYINILKSHLAKS